jgi:hypothetical protein
MFSASSAVAWAMAWALWEVAFELASRNATVSIIGLLLAKFARVIMMALAENSV